MKHLPLAILAALALVSCKQQAPTADTANPDAKPGLSVAKARLVLPAVKGNPAAAYFDVSNRGDGPTTLANVHIDGTGKAELHETRGGAMAPLNWVQLEAGQTVSFAPGGKHVMAFDLEDRLTAGGTTEMTLVFSDGDKLSTPIKVEAPGGGGDDHGAAH